MLLSEKEKHFEQNEEVENRKSNVCVVAVVVATILTTSKFPLCKSPALSAGER